MNNSITRPPSKYRPLHEALDECTRELQVRQRCYDRWVAEGKLTETEGRDRYERLASACYYLDLEISSLQHATAKAAAEQINFRGGAPEQEKSQTAAG